MPKDLEMPMKRKVIINRIEPENNRLINNNKNQYESKLIYSFFFISSLIFKSPE